MKIEMSGNETIKKGKRFTSITKLPFLIFSLLSVVEGLYLEKH